LPQIAMLHHLRARPRVWSANINVQAGPSQAFTLKNLPRKRISPALPRSVAVAPPATAIAASIEAPDRWCPPLARIRLRSAPL
jgi:hypothetical protein